MYGVLIRAGPGALMIALMGALAARILEPLLDMMLVEASQDDMLIKSVTAISENFILVGLIGLGITIVGAAVLEAKTGGA